MKKYFIIEDNQFHSEWIIKELVNHHIENIVQLTSISQINQLIQLGTIDNHDVFFIDIDLKQSLTGIDVAEQIRKKTLIAISFFHRLYELCSRYHQPENPSDWIYQKRQEFI